MEKPNQNKRHDWIPDWILEWRELLREIKNSHSLTDIILTKNAL